MSGKLQQWINSPWWEERDPLEKFAYFLLAVGLLAGMILAIVESATG